MNSSSWLEINLSRLESNVAWWRQLLHSGRAGGTKLCGIVKADAYGLGAIPVAQRLAGAGVDMLAVYSPAQAEDLLRHDVACPILILMPIEPLDTSDATRAAAALGRLHLSLNDPGAVASLQRYGQALDAVLPVHLHLDTGMSRGGLNPAEFARVLDQLPRCPNLRLAGVHSHFATADGDVSFADEQVERFERVVADHQAQLGPQVIEHIANTCGACRDRRYHKGMVRVGLGLHGHGPDLLRRRGGPMLPFPDPPLQPIFRWLARIVHVQRYPQGATVGYDCTRRLERDSVLGLVAAGYADGYPLTLSNKGIVRVLEVPGPMGSTEALAPVLGLVSMDQTVIDLTDIAAAHPHALKVGSLVELVSNDPASACSLPAVADLAGSTPYELLCRLSPRLAHRYVSIEVTAAASAGLNAAPVPAAAQRVKV